MFTVKYLLVFLYIIISVCCLMTFLFNVGCFVHLPLKLSAFWEIYLHTVYLHIQDDLKIGRLQNLSTFS